MFLNLLALLRIMFAGISAVEEFSIEQLNSNHSKDELKENVDNEDVENILERDNDTIKHSLQFWYPVYGFQWPKHSKQFDRF